MNIHDPDSFKDNEKVAAFEEECRRLAEMENDAARELQIKKAYEALGKEFGIKLIRKKVEKLRRTQKEAAEQEAAEERQYAETAEAAARRAANASAHDAAVQGTVDEFNQKYMVVNEAGKVFVYEPVHEPLLNRNVYTRFTFEAFRQFYMNRLIAVGQDKNGNAIFKTAADLWLTNPRRKQFKGVLFDPSGQHVRPGILNLWQGFSVEPKQGDWGLMRDLMFKVLCSGDADQFNYLYNWTARMFQCPGVQGEVAVVLRSKTEGVGKGMFGRACAHLLGQHSMQIASGNLLVNNFNMHLRDCIFLFADEAFFAGDKKHVGTLYSLITEQAIAIEGKYANAVMAPNFLHLLIASNADWVVPASSDARRFFVPTVKEQVERPEYYTALMSQMENGGYEAMLHELLNADISQFNVRKVPQTAGLAEQKTHSLNAEDAWWFDVLDRGYIWKSRFGLSDFEVWTMTASTDLLYASYEAFCKARKYGADPKHRVPFGKFMRTAGGFKQTVSNVLTGEYQTRDGEPVARRSACHGYKLRPLSEMRQLFETRTRMKIEWSNDGEPVF